jgi:hypothetical protein
MPGRRTLLKRIAGTGALAPLAGCADRTEPEPGEPIALDEWVPDLPVAERVDVLTEGVESGIETELSDAATFEATLADAGIDVETLTRREDELDVEYLGSPNDGVFQTLGFVAGAYASLVTSDYEATRLRATIADPERGPFGEYHAETDWAHEFDGGELTAEEYGISVADTLETVV